MRLIPVHFRQECVYFTRYLGPGEMGIRRPATQRGAAPLQKMGWHCVYNGNTTDTIDLHIFVDTCTHPLSSLHQPQFNHLR